jgi:hypothetical protein
VGINWDQDQPAPSTILSIIEQRFTIAPRGTTTGIYNPNHGPHGEGRALDIGLNANNTNDCIVGDLLVQCFIRNQQELRWAWMIWNHKEWDGDSNASRPVRGPLARDPNSPHTDHIHIDWNQPNSQLNNFPGFVADLDAMIQQMSGSDSNQGVSYVNLQSQ